jgi:thymidylate synthase (FAD)
MFLAKLTQRGHSISSLEDLQALYHTCVNENKHWNISRLAALPHGTIKRFTPITVAIVGASRRFLAQARTHQVGLTFVSASLQYSDYSGQADFVVPYEVLKSGKAKMTKYMHKCKADLQFYEKIRWRRL